MEVTEHEGAVFAAEVHAVSLTEREGLAGFAGFLLAHPGAVAIGLETVFPDLPERVAIDISLVVLAANGGASRYTAINQNGGYGDTCGTLIEMVTDASFVCPQVAFAGIGDVPSGFAFGDDEVHERLELRIGEQQFRILGCTSHRIDAEDTPVAHAERPEHVADSRQVVDSTLVDAGDDVPC